ncbi:hypothetical protein LMG9673_03640 [Ralstonia pseudosolanacearum]|nr:hypothetical protein LMG9673_03640 [Ralstonia pseudosolanacearum]
MKRISNTFSSMTPKLGSLSHSNSSSSSAREKRKTSAPESMRQGLPKRSNRNAESSQGPHVVYQVDSDSEGESPKRESPRASSPPSGFFDNLSQWIPDNAPAAHHGTTQYSSPAPMPSDFFDNLPSWMTDTAPPVHSAGYQVASPPPAHDSPAHEQPASPSADFFSNLSPWIPENAPAFDWEAYARKQGRK